MRAYSSEGCSRSDSDAGTTAPIALFTHRPPCGSLCFLMSFRSTCSFRCRPRCSSNRSGRFRPGEGPATSPSETYTYPMHLQFPLPPQLRDALCRSDRVAQLVPVLRVGPYDAVPPLTAPMKIARHYRGSTQTIRKSLLASSCRATSTAS